MTAPGDELLEFARGVEQNDITSDALPAYVQMLLSARLIEPDATCRRVAFLLSFHQPPLTSGDVAARLYRVAQRMRDRDRMTDRPSTPTTVASGASRVLAKLVGLMCSVRRFWAKRRTHTERAARET